MHPVIAAYDGSPHADDALAFAAWAAARLEAPLDVCCAYPVGGRAAHAYDEVMRAAAEDDLAQARAVPLPGADVSYTALPASSPGKALQEHAEDREARLLVLGSSRHAAAYRTVAGTLAGRLLHGAPCPVAVVPSGWARRSPSLRSVVVGWQAGPEGDRALAAGEDLARRAGVPLELVEAALPGTPAADRWPMLTMPEPSDETGAETAAAELKAAAAGVDAVVHVRTTVLVGEPAHRLREHAGDDDVLVLGSRGYGPVRSVLLGSVSKAIVADSPCPVVVVPRPGRRTLFDGPSVASTAGAAGS